MTTIIRPKFLCLPRSPPTHPSPNSHPETTQIHEKKSCQSHHLPTISSTFTDPLHLQRVKSYHTHLLPHSLPQKSDQTKEHAQPKSAFSPEPQPCPSHRPKQDAHKTASRPNPHPKCMISSHTIVYRGNSFQINAFPPPHEHVGKSGAASSQAHQVQAAERWKRSTPRLVVKEHSSIPHPLWAPVMKATSSSPDSQYLLPIQSFKPLP